ncbi:hypothetical protein [Prosthecobacter sp.]|uniref:hypothetical protein n=1 Tax=Prosthecobacter sp. TaxID=1965333 RepID=UPI0037848079
MNEETQYDDSTGSEASRVCRSDAEIAIVLKPVVSSAKEAQSVLEKEKWNAEDLCASRLEVLRSFFDREVSPKVVWKRFTGFTNLLEDFDLDLLNRDLGWTRQAILVAKIEFCKAASATETDQVAMPDSYALTCRIFRKEADLSDVSSQPEPGDFLLFIGQKGELESFSVRRVGATPLEAGEVRSLLSTRRRVDLLDPEQSEESVRSRAAANADRVIQLMQRGTVFNPNAGAREIR